MNTTAQVKLKSKASYQQEWLERQTPEHKAELHRRRMQRQKDKRAKERVERPEKPKVTKSPTPIFKALKRDRKDAKVNRMPDRIQDENAKLKVWIASLKAHVYIPPGKTAEEVEQRYLSRKSNQIGYYR